MYRDNRIENVSLLDTIQLTLALSVAVKRENLLSKRKRSED
jgi:hypothetical protein